MVFAALHVAAQEGHSDVLITLLEQQNMASLDAVDDRGRTSLMYAAASGWFLSLSLLIIPALAYIFTR